MQLRKDKRLLLVLVVKKVDTCIIHNAHAAAVSIYSLPSAHQIINVASQGHSRRFFVSLQRQHRGSPVGTSKWKKSHFIQFPNS